MTKEKLHPPPPLSQCRSFSPSIFNRHISAGEISSSLNNWVSRFRSKSLGLVFSGALALDLSLSGSFLSFDFDLEKDTGFKLRVLAQNYPVTPGLAIKDFRQVDDSTIVFVADPTFGNISIVEFLQVYAIQWETDGDEWIYETGNILNFNVGATVDLDVPRSFWN